MEAKKIISAIAILVFMVLYTTAQEVNKFEKFQDRLKKGTSTLSMNINLFQYIETRNCFEDIFSPSIKYSYFLINRFSINTSLSIKQNFFSYFSSNNPFYRIHKSIDVGFRYYFFKRGGIFIGLGGSFGHIFIKMTDEEFGETFGRKFYAAPKVDIGYSYMISNMWKKIDNKVSINFLMISYIPCKRYKNFDECDTYMPYFPFFNFELGVVYYFLRK